MLTTHKALIDFRNLLGYQKDDRGTCALYAEMAINAFLLSDSKAMDTFHQRCTYIKQKLEDPNFINLVNKVKQHGFLPQFYSSEEEHELPDLLDAIIFIESGELYLNPEHYSNVFNQALNQDDKLKLSAFAQSKDLEALGGRAQVSSFVGIYNKEELAIYIELLNQLAQEAKQNVALSLASDNHAIALCYLFDAKEWQLIDVNQPELPAIASNHSEFASILSDQILEAFYDTTYTAFSPYIKLLNQSAQEAKQNFKVRMERNNHAIELCYLFDSKEWQLTDANQPELPTNVSNHSKSLTDLILETFTDTTTAFSTQIWSTTQSQNGIRSAIKMLNKNARFNTIHNAVTHAQHVTQRGITLASMAVTHNHKEVLALLINTQNEDETFRVDLNQACNDGATLALVAAVNGYKETLALLINAQNKNGTFRVDLNMAHKGGATPVCVAAQNGHKEALALLINAQNQDGTFRVDLNQARDDGITPAFIAAQNGHEEALALLINAQNQDRTFRVDLNQVRNDGITPAWMAAQNGHKEALALLINAQKQDGTFRVDLKKTNENGATLAFIAAQNGHKEALALLINAQNQDGTFRVDLNQARDDGVTPALMAAHTGNKDILELLIKARDKDGHSKVTTSLEVLISKASQQGHQDIVQLLQEEQIRRSEELNSLFTSTLQEIKRSLDANSINKTNNANVERLLISLRHALNLYEQEMKKTLSSDALLQITEEFKMAFNKMKNVALDSGLIEDDGINNVFSNTVNGLNHLISALGKLTQQGHHYNFFTKKNHLSPELRAAFQELSSVTHIETNKPMY